MSKQNEILNALGYSKTEGPSSGELEKALWGKKKKTLEIDLEKRALALPQTHVNLLMKIQEYLDSSHTPL